MTAACKVDLLFSFVESEAIARMHRFSFSHFRLVYLSLDAG